MLLCGECNRSKSWVCEHCANWLELKRPEICASCYWASPEAYTHVAMRDLRRVDLVWTEEEIAVYEQFKARAVKNGISLPDYLKSILRDHLDHQ